MCTTRQPRNCSYRQAPPTDLHRMPPSLRSAPCVLFFSFAQHTCHWTAASDVLWHKYILLLCPLIQVAVPDADVASGYAYTLTYFKVQVRGLLALGAVEQVLARSNLVDGAPLVEPWCRITLPMAKPWMCPALSPGETLCQMMWPARKFWSCPSAWLHPTASQP